MKTLGEIERIVDKCAGEVNQHLQALHAGAEDLDDDQEFEHWKLDQIFTCLAMAGEMLYMLHDMRTDREKAAKPKPTSLHVVRGESDKVH